MPVVPVHHIALRTREVSRIARFYVAAIGLQRIKRTARSVWLRAGDVVVMIERAEPGERKFARGTMELLCFGVGSRVALAEARRRVERLARVEGETSYTFYFRDPDGRRVGVSCYPVRHAHERGRHAPRPRSSRAPTPS